MRKTVCLTLAGIILATPVLAQGMGGVGGPGGGEPGGGHGPRGNHGGARDGQTPDMRPAPAIIPATLRLKGLVTIAGEAKTLKGTPLSLDLPDMSAIYALRGAQVTLDDMSIATSGAATLVDNTRQYGMNSALLIDSGAQVKMQGGKIATRGLGATAIHASGEDSAIDLTDTTITTDGSGAYGIEIANGARLSAQDVSVATQSDHAVALSLQRGRPVSLVGGRFTTAGPFSPALLLESGLESTGITAEARRAEAVIIAGQAPVSFADSRLSGEYGVVIYTPSQAEMAPAGNGPPMRGPNHDEPGASGGNRQGPRPVTDMMARPGPDGDALSLIGGVLVGRRAAFYVTNRRTRIRLDSVDVTATVILRAAADQWGELGRNGGDVTLDAHHQSLTGDFVTDAISHIAVNLSDNSHLTGKATRNTDIALDATSIWTLSDDGSVGKLTGDLARIDSQGHTLSYDKIRNPAFNGQTLDLPGGGKLVPGL